MCELMKEDERGEIQVGEEGHSKVTKQLLATQEPAVESTQTYKGRQQIDSQSGNQFISSIDRKIDIQVNIKRGID